MKPLNIAHRGGAGLWPENTLYAFMQAADSGFDGAELDVQLTRDGRVVVFHDFRPKPRTCRDPNGRPLIGRQPPICEWDYAALEALDIGQAEGGPAPRTGERIPLLAQVIEAVQSRKPGFRLFIELKTAFKNRGESASPEGLAEAVLGVLAKTRFIENAILVGFDWPGLVHAKRLAPEVACWLTSQRAREERKARDRSWAAGFDPRDYGGPVRAIRAAGAEGWFPHYSDVTAENVRAAREAGLRVGAWTVNESAEMGRLIALGLDAICTDRPDRLAAALD